MDTYAGENDGCDECDHEVAKDGVCSHSLAVGSEHTADDGD